MNELHQQILEEIRSLAPTKLRHHDTSYSGSTHPSYQLSVPSIRLIVKNWLSKNKELSHKELLELINSLYQGDSKEEKKIAGHILGYSTALRSTINPAFLDSWLDQLEGWEEVDSLCQSVFTENDLILNWPGWQVVLEKFNSSTNPQKRRASLVLLTRPVDHSADKRLSNQAFKNIDHLKKDSNILITKAISWLLRELIWYHREEVQDYLTKNRDSLPKIAVRETLSKLQTGKK